MTAYQEFQAELGMSAAQAGVASAGVVVLVALLWWWSYHRYALLVTGDGFTIRTLVSSRSTPWSQVQEIQREGDAAVVRLAGGTRLPLPCLDQRNLDRWRRSLDQEIGTIREVWLRGRGPSWVPLPVTR